MSKRFAIALGLAGALGLYLAYLSSGADNIQGLWDWIRSLSTRVSLKINSFLDEYMSGDETQKAIAKALDFIASREGFSSRAYADPPGQANTFSIGYGHQITPGDELSTTSVIDESEGFSLLSDDVQSRVDCVLGSVSVPLTVNQLASLISFAYNEGCAAFQSSTLLRLLNSGDSDGAANEFPKWVYANGVVNQGLVSRRAAEQSLFLEA